MVSPKPGLDEAAQEMKAFPVEASGEGTLEPYRGQDSESTWPTSLISQKKAQRWGLIKGHSVEVLSRRENWAVESPSREPAPEKWKAGMEA